MKTLKALKLAPLERGANHAETRRASLIRGLEHQRSLALDGSYVRQAEQWQPDVNGAKNLVRIEKRVRPWWREDVTGVLRMVVRYGARPIELEKGKPAIIIASREQLIPTIDTVIAAVKAGELDEHLLLLAKARKAPVAKRAV